MIVNKLTCNLMAGNYCDLYKCPIPFKNQKGKLLGKVVAVSFNGKHTVGEIELEEGITLPEVQGDIELCQTPK